MNEIYLSYGGLITPLGDTLEANFQSMQNGISGVQKVTASGYNNENWPLGKIADLPEENRYDALLTRLCQRLKENISAEVLANSRTLFVVSTTKSNLEALPNDTFASTREILTRELQCANAPLIISNACISGVLAINTAADYIQSGKFDTVITIGIDVLSPFIINGFQSLFALSDEPSLPFDEARKGISIGEAAGAIVVSNQLLNDDFHVRYLGGSSSNDANHISGPSRTGEGLYRSVTKTLERAGVDGTSIDFISAHGTGTLYNDEMESIAFDRLGMNDIPLNSLKGFFGHTLGAAGIIEIIATMMMMEHNVLIKSVGFSTQGTSKNINVLQDNYSTNVHRILKTASGFGGGNASLILEKNT